MAVGVVWLAARGSRPRAWLLGIPALLAALWFVSLNGALVLLNLI